MTTVIITTTFASVKFWPATTSAAAVLRWAVPSESTPRVSAPGPPSTHPMPKQMATKISAATMPNEPRMLTMLPKVSRRGQDHDENHADARHRRDECPDATGSRGMPRSQREPNGQRNQHQQNQRSGDVGWIHGDALEQQREDDRHIANRDDHQHDHQADREWHVGLRQIGELEEKRSAARESHQQQSDRQWFIQAEHSGEPDGAIGASTKFASRDSTTSRPFRSGARICGTVSAETRPTGCSRRRTPRPTHSPR